MDFVWEKNDRKAALIENDEIICWWLVGWLVVLKSNQNIKKRRQKYFYLDGTWINVGYFVKQVRQDKLVTNARQAFIGDSSTDLKFPNGKGGRLIITHIGGDEGFVHRGLLEFVSISTNDYHEDMTVDVFEEYFSQMIYYRPIL